MIRDIKILKSLKTAKSMIFYWVLVLENVFLTKFKYVGGGYNDKTNYIFLRGKPNKKKLRKGMGA